MPKQRVDVLDIVKELLSIDPATAKAAIKKFHLMATEAYPVLVAELEKKPENATIRAVELLGDYPGKESERILEKLLNVFEKDEFMVATILIQLGRNRSERALEIIKPYLNDANRRIRANAVEAIGLLDNQEVVPLLRKALEDHDNRVRANALVALWQKGDRSMVEVLKEMMSHPENLMKSSARYALGRIGIHELEGFLAGTFGLDNSETFDNTKVPRDVSLALGLLFSKRFS